MRLSVVVSHTFFVRRHVVLTGHGMQPALLSVCGLSVFARGCRLDTGSSVRDRYVSLMAMHFAVYSIGDASATLSHIGDVAELSEVLCGLVGRYVVVAALHTCCRRYCDACGACVLCGTHRPCGLV